MKHAPALVKRANLLILAGMLAAASLVPALLMQKVSAYAQPTERSIEISTSEVSATDVEYIVKYTAATTGTIEGIVIDFCTSPLVGTACTAPAGLNTNFATLALVETSGISGFSVDTTNSEANMVVLTNAGGDAMVAGTTDVEFSLGSTGGSDAFTNPSGNGSFYARIITFDQDTDAQAYDSDTAPNANNPGATAVDAGGVAMSTANQLTVNARVQEVLTFCVGTTDADTNGDDTDDCTDISGTTVDLGVVQAGAPSISPVPVLNGGNNLNGLAMVRTNGVNGVVIDYFAEAVTGDAGSEGYAGGLGALRVAGTTCAGDGTIATGSKTDQCFNSAGTTRLVFNSTDEGFGMTVSSILNTVDGASSNGTTANLQVDGEYCGDGTNAAVVAGCTGGDPGSNGGGWAWSQTTTDTIASSTGSAVKVVDDELLTLRFAAQAAVTTPTGQYGVTSTYIATASF